MMGGRARRRSPRYPAAVSRSRSRPDRTRGSAMTPADLSHYLRDCRALALEEIRRIVPRGSRYSGGLYDVMLDYPLREAKGLRPALCVAACRALGGHLAAALPSAAVMELYHNAFLIHDDVEDGSELRRDAPTLHRVHGVPVAVNVGDAMLALALQPLLDNTRLLDLGRALRILEVVARMARESAEGQAMELQWIRHGDFDLTDRDYTRMVHKKTGWYTFIAPVAIGAIAADADPRVRGALERFAALLGIAFQIRDDVLNLVADEKAYGKEVGGDLWEGKHTLILLHALRHADPLERAEARRILALPRSAESGTRAAAEVLDRIAPGLAALEVEGVLAPGARVAVEALVSGADWGARSKGPADVEYLMGLVGRYDSVGYAEAVASRWARRARRVLDSLGPGLRPSVHRDFLHGLVDYVVRRDR